MGLIYFVCSGMNSNNGLNENMQFSFFLCLKLLKIYKVVAFVYLNIDLTPLLIVGARPFFASKVSIKVMWLFKRWLHKSFFFLNNTLKWVLWWLNSIHVYHVVGSFGTEDPKMITLVKLRFPYRVKSNFFSESFR